MGASSAERLSVCRLACQPLTCTVCWRHLHFIFYLLSSQIQIILWFFFSFCPVTPFTLLTPHVTPVIVVVVVASCRWSFGGIGLSQMIILTWGAGLLQMIIRRSRPFSNGHSEGPASCKWSSVTSVTLVTSAKVQIQSRRPFWNNWFLFLSRTNRQTRWFYWLILWQLWQIHGTTFTNTYKNFDKCL